MTPPRSDSRRAGILRPAVLDSLVTELGHRRDRRSRAHDALARSRRPARAPACCRSTRCRRASRRPYSALSAMAIDPQFITLDAVEDFAAIGGEAALEPELRARLDAARAARAIDYAAVRRLKRDGAAPCVRALPRTEWRGETHARVPVPRLRRRTGVVARRLRAVPRAARALRRAAVDRLAGAAARHASRGARSAARRAGRRGPVPPVPAVDCRRSVGAPRAHVPAASRCSATCRSWSARDSADVWARQDEFRLDAVGRRAAGRLQRDRAGLGAAGLPVGRARRARFRLAAPARPPQRRPLRRLSRRSPRRLLPHVLPAASAAAEGAFTPADEAAQTALGERVLDVFREPAPRSSPRISASFPTSCASRWRGSASRATRCFAGSGAGTCRASRSRIRRAIPRCRWPRRARTTPSRW